MLSGSEYSFAFLKHTTLTFRLLVRKKRNFGQSYLTSRWRLFLLGAGIMMKFWKNLTGPCGAPTYLPTYLPYLWETKKEITGRVKVGYYTN